MTCAINQFTSSFNGDTDLKLIHEIPVNLENVEKIVNEFYQTSQLTNEYKPKLDEWLKQAQTTKEAWSFSWSLIDMNKSVMCQFYGASCLYLKVSKYLSDVPTDDYDLLKNKLLEKLLLYAVNLNKHEQIRLIQRKLNAALAKLALYLITDQWQNCINDIIQTIPNVPIQAVTNEASTSNDTPCLDINNLNKMQLILIVVDLLTLLPEEYGTLSSADKQKRSQINLELKKSFHLIREYVIKLFNEFNQIANVPNSSLKQVQMKLVENLVKCLTSWTEFGIQFDELNVFLDYLFMYIYNEHLFEHTAECLTVLFGNQGNTKYTKTIFKYTPRILELGNLLAKYVQNKDTDGCVVLTKLILEFGENQLQSLFDGLLYGDESTKQILLQFISLIMNLSSMPGNFPVDEESSDLTFVFWYTLQDTLLGIEGQQSINESQSNQLQLVFRPFFVNLLEIFIVKLQLADNYDEWSDEEKERLRCYRIDIGDTMVYMISIIGEIMLEFIIKRLLISINQSIAQSENEQQTGEIEKKSNSKANNNVWKLQEALIYMLQSVVSELNESCGGDFANQQNDQYLIDFISLLPKINYSNKHILSTTLLAIGSLGNWLQRNLEILPNSISLCLLGLKTDSVTQSASFALKDIIMECDLSQYADQIISTCQECLKIGICAAQNYEVRLMSIIGICISDLLQVDLDRSLNWLQLIIEPYIIKLDELANLKGVVDKQQQAMTCHVLNMLTQLMTSLIQRQRTFADESIDSSLQSRPNQSMNQNESMNKSTNEIKTTHNNEKKIVNSLLVKLIPIYKTIIKRNLPTDLILIDKIFESISVNLSSSLTESSTNNSNEPPIGIELLINDLIEMFYMLNESSWKRYAHEACRQLIINFWKNEKYKTLLENLFLYSYQNTMKLTLRDMNWFHEHTDVVEQYCTCLAKILKSKYYDLFEKLNMENLNYLIKFAQLALQLPEQYTLRAVATFVEEFIKFTKTKNYLVELIQQNAFSILEVIILGISGALPRHLVDILAGILHAFVKEYPQLTNNVLNQILSSNSFISANNSVSTSSPSTTNVSNSQHKAKFLRSILSDTTNNKRKFKEAVNEFSLTCRGLQDTQYGKETSQSQRRY